MIQVAGAPKQISVQAVSQNNSTSIRIQRRASVSTVDTMRILMGAMFALEVSNSIS